MIIGTLGAGEVAQAFAIHLLKAGHEVLLSNSRGPSSLTQLVSKLGNGARAVTMDEAAKAPIVVLAVPWPEKIRAAAALVASHQLRAPIAAVYPARRFEQALAHALAGGKVLLDFADGS